MSFSMYFFTLLCLLALILVGFTLYRRNQSKNVSKAFYQQELLQAKLEIQEQTCQMAAAIIHDHIGQLLCLAKLNLNRLPQTSTENDFQKVTEAKALIGQSITDLRSLSKTLRNDVLFSKGLQPALEIIVQSINNAGIKTVNLETEGITERLDSETEMLLFNIIQQAVHLLLKQAYISSILIKANWGFDQFKLEIICHGTKKLLTTTLWQETIWPVLKTRAKLIGATLEIISTPEAATTIHIYLPLKNQRWQTLHW